MRSLTSDSQLFIPFFIQNKWNIHFLLSPHNWSLWISFQYTFLFSSRNTEYNLILFPFKANKESIDYDFTIVAGSLLQNLLEFRQFQLEGKLGISNDKVYSEGGGVTHTILVLLPRIPALNVTNFHQNFPQIWSLILKCRHRGRVLPLKAVDSLVWNGQIWRSSYHWKSKIQISLDLVSIQGKVKLICKIFLSPDEISFH